MQYQPREKHQFTFAAHRRINRPEYDNLNPYKTFQNTLLSWSGNAFLRPDYSNTIEFAHIFNGYFTNSIAYTKTEAVVSFAYLINDTTKTLHALPVNLKDKQQLTYSLFLQKSFGKRLNSTLKADGSYVAYRGTFQGSDFGTTAFAWSASVDNVYLVAKHTKLEVNAYYEGPWLNGIMRFGGRGFLDLGAKRSFLDGRLNIGFAVKDVFYTFLTRLNYAYGTQQASVVNHNDSRRFNFSLSYAFGKLKAQQREVRSNTEEQERRGGK